MYFLALLLYKDGGNEYSSSDKKELISVNPEAKNIIIEPQVETIKGDSTSLSSAAFYSCRNNIQNVSFGANSQCNRIGDNLFSQTSIKFVDFTNCKYLTTISSGCFSKCSQLTEVTLPPNLITISPGAFYQSLGCTFFAKTLAELQVFCFSPTKILILICCSIGPAAPIYVSLA